MTLLQTSLRLQAPGLVPRDPAEADVLDRLARLPGYQAGALARQRVLLGGAGGLGGEIAHGLVRNGFGFLAICDYDTVELSNLNRQRFHAADLYRNKALQLARQMQFEAIQPLTVEGYAFNLQTVLEQGLVRGVTLLICAVDNDVARVAAARWGLAQRVPVIVMAVNNTADYGYVFVQTSRPGEPCFGCLFPDAASNQRVAPCAIGAAIDILKTMAGPVLYAAGALALPQRPFGWRYKEISLSGATPDGTREIPARPACPLCGPSRSPNGSQQSHG